MKMDSHNGLMLVIISSFLVRLTNFTKSVNFLAFSLAHPDKARDFHL